MKHVLLAAAVFFCSAACEPELGGVGAPCESSGMCADGLVCDFGRRTHTCQMTQTVRDMAARVDAAGDGGAQVNDGGGDDFGVPDLSTVD